MRSEGSDPSLLRWMNAVRVLRQLRSVDEMTSAEIAKSIQLARSTVEEALAVLSEKRLVEELAPVTPRGRAGRPARRYRFRREAGCAVGIGVDHLQIGAMVSDLNGAILRQHARPLPNDINAVDPVEEIVDTVREALTAVGLTQDQLYATAVGLPGLITPGGRVLRCDPAPAWAGLPVSDLLAEHLGCPVTIENHGRMAVVGECWKGPPAGAEDVLFLIGGIGLGVGLIVNGEVVRGRHGAAGEIGHHPLFTGTVTARLRDLLAAAAPGEAPEEAAARALTAGPDPAFAEFRSHYVEYLASVVSMLVLTVDPEHIILGGSLARADNDLVDEIRHHIEAIVLVAPTVTRSSIGDNAIALGGVRQALSLVERTLLDPSALSRAQLGQSVL